MFLSIKKLSKNDKKICQKTISSKAIYAIVGDAILRQKSISIVRMGDGECKILKADKTKPFTAFNYMHNEWNKKLGIENMPTDILQKNIIEAGNSCSYFAPSVSGISLSDYYLYNFFKPRREYFDNFYVNDWTAEMIKRLFEASDGICILHRDYKKIISNFKKTYKFKNTVVFKGFPKNNWDDNEQSIDFAVKSGMQLVLYSGGPGAKIIGPKIAKAKNKVVLDVGNTLLPWSIKR
ncbi:MAG: hypothetical protein A2534_00290 [Candidatus Magasanikbacteria bacterium RIFOXYD2_FULL_39_9]|uniref:GT-D fold-like domain-containing protein n=1 Tax=Candidatus Magasanikbacteria bacterium RIFOXYD1_FULL_40_23 TaxID=1798705 RepID=A0A1F6P9H9_9BACT|nr:MAG: hypothetical protein A2534_00290 [Candidatus Magasanikbacteria bacterium RIFOXYD2_FULL_39_9]OGH92768.1 MAG: hypothetical protein A2563_03815 [Candidatus Magasanikbacteria bacterium RIFOXYD1_FULL_40_23]